MKLKRFALGLFLVVPLAVVGLALAAGAFDGAKSATARFHDLEKAEAAGYGKFLDAAGIACIESPTGAGAMGVHYVKGGLVGDAVIDPAQPEALVYQPKPGGGVRLVALEYIVFQDLWHAAGHVDPPSLFGRRFDFTAFPNRYGIPAFYSLHAWIWKPNPSGILEPYNPRVEC